MSRGSVSLSVDTTALTNGDRRISVLVSDLAGNVTTALEQVIEVDNPLPPVPATVNRGSNATTPGVSGDLAGVQATPCVAPRLVVDLKDKPARREKGVAVLLSGGRYKFTGRLTCRTGNGRRAAPKRAILDVFSRVGRRVQEDYGPRPRPRASSRRSSASTSRARSSSASRAPRATWRGRDPDHRREGAAVPAQGGDPRGLAALRDPERPRALLGAGGASGDQGRDGHRHLFRRGLPVRAPHGPPEAQPRRDPAARAYRLGEPAAARRST